MSESFDAFETLRRPVTPLAPPSEFAAWLRGQIERELGMTLTDDSTTPASDTSDGTLGLVHFRVGNADRAMAFYGPLFDWEGERVEFDNHVSYYTTNTGEVTVRILDDADYPAVVPNYQVSHVRDVVRGIEEAGGTIARAAAAPDGGGWARAEDDQQIPLLVYRPHERYAGATASATGKVGVVFIRADVERARRFYGSLFGWDLPPAHPGSSYFEGASGIGIFDEEAAFGRPATPSVTLYFAVERLGPVLERVVELGGRAGAPALDMGPYYSAVCTDDQGTEFGLMALALE